MNEYVENASYVALVDDDPHSAQLLMRMLAAHGGPRIQWFGDAADANVALVQVLSQPSANHPGLVIVDLKAHSEANAEFLRSIQPLPHQRGVGVVVLIHPAEQAKREALEDSGAAAIFYRHAERDAYRREAASLVSFWARSQRLDAVGM